MTTALMSTYSRLPVTFERGDGARLWDVDGREYLDLLAGIAVCGLGHAHPAVTRAVCEQAGRIIHTSNLYGIEKQALLAGELVDVAEMERVFFCNSGAEANEAAFKIARMYAHQRGIEVPEIVVAEGSFHGRTLATLSATGNRKVQAGFEPLVQGFVRVPFNDVEALSTVARTRPGVAAVLVEPVQGEGGIVVPDDDYLARVRDICDEFGWLMMLDEIQSGMGRTGKWFAWQRSGAHPDVVTIAKALGNGIPIGACLARGAAAEALQPGSHGSTFGGNPLACSAALAVMETIRAERLEERATHLGTVLVDVLRSEFEGTDGVREVRGLGLMVGIELDRPCADIVPRALAAGLLVNVTAQRVIRLLPPLIIDEDALRDGARTLAALVRDFCNEGT